MKCKGCPYDYGNANTCGAGFIRLLHTFSDKEAYWAGRNSDQCKEAYIKDMGLRWLMAATDVSRQPKSTRR